MKIFSLGMYIILGSNLKLNTKGESYFLLHKYYSSGVRGYKAAKAPELDNVDDFVAYFDSTWMISGTIL